MRARRLLTVVAVGAFAAAGGIATAGPAGAVSSDDDFQADRFFLFNQATSQCADLSIKSPTGDEVVQEPCMRRPTQVWVAQPLPAEPYFQLDVTGDGIPVVQERCTPKVVSQQWQFVLGPVPGPTRVVNRVLGQCLEVSGGSLAEGAPLQVSTCDNSVPHQVWRQVQPMPRQL